MLTQAEFAEFIFSVGRRARLRNPKKYHTSYSGWDCELEVKGYQYENIGDKHIYSFLLKRLDIPNCGVWVARDEVEFVKK